MLGGVATVLLAGLYYRVSFYGKLNGELDGNECVHSDASSGSRVFLQLGAPCGICERCVPEAK
jgi:hypothetical protein